MSGLDRVLREMIASDGPVTVERFMALALGHPVHGYYPTRDPLGAAGDFTTAPEISQMFGELLGLWAAETWTGMGRPNPVRLVELGPGRGTLMADALRAARVLPGFLPAIDVHLVETSPALRDRQAATLAAAGVPISWHARLEDVPAGPAIVLANEFLDALPIRQFVRGETGWHERLVGLDEAGNLAFGLAREPEHALRGSAPNGAILEVAEARNDVAALLASRLAREGGAALLIDYGHDRSGFGDTLQAVRAHGFADPLAHPGEQDLTSHVNFEALGAAARPAGARVHGPVAQGRFLRALGIEARAARLRAGAITEVARQIDAALARLTGSGAGEMGELFRVTALSHPGLVSLPGFDRPGDVTIRHLETAC